MHRHFHHKKKIQLILGREKKIEEAEVAVFKVRLGHDITSHRPNWVQNLVAQTQALIQEVV